MVDPARALQADLWREIPLSAAMGVTVVEAGHDGVSLQAPLALNGNHQATAFGGSLYAIAVLAGWALLRLRLAEQGLSPPVLIQAGHIHYLRPLADDLRACCRLTDERAFERFIHTFRRRGRARIALDTEVADDGGAAARFCGKYVIHP